MSLSNEYVTKADEKALVNRLPGLQDLAAHGASSDQSVADQSGGSGGGDGFKEGMEGDERERTSTLYSFFSFFQNPSSLRILFHVLDLMVLLNKC